MDHRVFLAQKVLGRGLALDFNFLYLVHQYPGKVVVSSLPIVRAVGEGIRGNHLELGEPEALRFVVVYVALR